MKHLKYIIYLLFVAFVASSCRENDIIIYPTENNVGDKLVSNYLGLYVLNEGNMGSNKATLDYLDLSTGVYSRNIYPSRNPNLIKELGDVGNDVQIYGNSLWMVINMSHKVEVADAKTAVSRGHVDIPNCRYLAFDGGFAYVSTYVGLPNSESVLGAVYKVDTASLKVVDKCIVGYQPDELVVNKGKLYVANSGGYNGMKAIGYDNRVSVIDLKTFKVTNTIKVAPNLFRVRNDKYGRLWVSSRGDMKRIPSKLFIVENDVVVDSLDSRTDGFDFRGDSLISYSGKGAKTKFKVIDIRTMKIVNDDFLKFPTDVPIKTAYGIIIHPATGDVYVMDATNYVSSGKIYCFDKDGNYKWHTLTGDIPGHACFLMK